VCVYQDLRCFGLCVSGGVVIGRVCVWVVVCCGLWVLLGDLFVGFGDCDGMDGMGGMSGGNGCGGEVEFWWWEDKGLGWSGVVVGVFVDGVFW